MQMKDQMTLKTSTARHSRIHTLPFIRDDPHLILSHFISSRQNQTRPNQTKSGQIKSDQNHSVKLSTRISQSSLAVTSRLSDSPMHVTGPSWPTNVRSQTPVRG